MNDLLTTFEILSKTKVYCRIFDRFLVDGHPVSRPKLLLFACAFSFGIITCDSCEKTNCPDIQYRLVYTVYVYKRILSAAAPNMKYKHGKPFILYYTFIYTYVHAERTKNVTHNILIYDVRTYL